MTAPDITKQPSSQAVAAGDGVRFEVEATGADLTYQWQRAEQNIVGATSDSYEFTARVEDNGAEFRVVVHSGTDKRISDSATLSVSAESPPLWDSRFALWAGVSLALAFVLVLWPIWVFAGRVTLRTGDATPAFPAVIAIALVIIGALAALAGIYLAFLEFRGRARTMAEVAAPRGTLGAAEEVAKSIPQILKAFGELKAPASILLLAALLFLGATAIAWRGLPNPTTNPTTNPTPSPSSSVSPSGSPSPSPSVPIAPSASGN